MSNVNLNRDINSIVKRPRIVRRPPIVKPVRVGQPATTGKGTLAGTSTEQGQGIDSPLTEQSRVTVDFEVLDQFNVWSVIIQVATKIKMTDASELEVVFNYTDPNDLIA